MADALGHRGRLTSEPGVRDDDPLATIGVALPRDDGALGGRTRVAGHVVGIAGRLPPGVSVDTVAVALAQRGCAALDDLGGEWIVAWRNERTLVVARDALGVRTAYWGSHRGRVLVGVEPKAVLAAPGFPRTLDVGAIGQFLTFSFVPGERCTLRDLREIPAGHRLEVDLATGDTRTVRWFFHEEVEPEDCSPEAAVSMVRAAVDRAVADRLPGNDDVTAFLSGGLDSSVVVCAAAAMRRERGDSPPKTFSLHFGEEYPSETEFAQMVADRAGTDHSTLEVTGREVGECLREMIWHLDDPIGDPVTAGNYVLARIASEHSGWVLNGEGGDPVFGGPKNLPMLLAHWYPTLDDPDGREERYLATWRRAGEEVLALLHPDLRSEFDRERDLVDVVRPYLRADQPHHFLNKLMVANMRLKGAHLILPKVDRMVGAFSMTPLSPLFDREVVRTSLRVPPGTKLRSGIEKWALKEAYRDLVPAEVIARPKSGMRVPVRHWFRGELRAEARSVLSPRAIRRAGIFDERRVRDMRRYRTGRDGIRLWMLMTFELWRRNVFGE